MRKLIQRFYNFWGRTSIGTYAPAGPGDPAFILTMAVNLLLTLGCVITLGTPARGVVIIPLLSYWGIYGAGNFVVRLVGGLVWRHQLHGSNAENAVERIQHLSWCWPGAVLLSTAAAPFYLGYKAIHTFNIGTERYLLEQVKAPPLLPTKSRTD